MNAPAEGSRTLLILNGPNLNLLGTREPEVYGEATLEDAIELASAAAERAGWTIESFQSNSEGALIDRIHAARGNVAGIIANLGAYSHTSLAIADALAAVNIPVVEVHVSNVFAREGFRHHSYISALARTVIVGAGIDGYRLATEHLTRSLPSTV